MRVFITGMAGTLGTALARFHTSLGHEVHGCSRDEERCRLWQQQFEQFGHLLIADAFGLADRSSVIGRLLPSCDLVYHCAAMKHVDLCESNPTEAVRQNVLLTGAVASACAAAKVPLVFSSTDKACLPEGVYGATKLLAEKIAVGAGAAVLRLGNLIGSSGSVFQRWKEQVARGEEIQVTDPSMTRYFISLRYAVHCMWECFLTSPYQGVFVPNTMLAASIGDIAYNIAGTRVRVIGARPGETKHQWLVGPGTLLQEKGSLSLLGKGDRCERGLNSEWAQRWKTEDLLKEAGVNG